MESMKIYHLDIKPTNFLYTSERVLKIIDFSISEIESNDPINSEDKDMHFIKGTQGYMAPEIQDFALKDNRIKIKYDRNKADVFSLGMVLLEMYCLEELHTLNYTVNNKMLMKTVSKVKYPWLKTLLKNMLEKDYKERPSFIDCVKFLPGRDTTVTKENLSVTQYAFNFINATCIKEIPLNDENDKFKVKMYLYICPINGNVAIKAYTRIKPEYNMNRIFKEIEILETLSKRARPENCFIKFYGKSLTQDQVWFAMEYHRTNLREEIIRIEESRQKFSEIKLIWMAKELISAFAEMESMNIYHQDIKPHKILVTSDGRLKIFDTGVSESKVDHESTLSKTEAHSIQGARGYMAPELETARKNVQKEANFKSGKADVFSLGITLLQLYFFEELHTFNHKENNQKLMKKVEAIYYPWLSTLLTKMLQVNYNDRPSFKKCLDYIPDPSTPESSCHY